MTCTCDADDLVFYCRTCGGFWCEHEDCDCASDQMESLFRSMSTIAIVTVLIRHADKTTEVINAVTSLLKGETDDPSESATGSEV